MHHLPMPTDPISGLLFPAANGAAERSRLIRDLAAPPAASRVHGDGPLDVTAVCPLTAAGSPTLKSRSDCHLWLGLDGGRNEFVTLKEHRGALKSVDARAAVAARSARKTSKWQRSDQT